MKYVLYIALILTLSNTVAIDFSAKKEFFSRGYTEEELVSARIAWAHQERRVGQLKYEANLGKKKAMEYVSAGNNHVATFNAEDQTIATYIEEGKAVTLSYGDFFEFLRDEKIIDLANKRLQEEEDKKSKKFNIKN